MTKDGKSYFPNFVTLKILLLGKQNIIPDHFRTLVGDRKAMGICVYDIQRKILFLV